MTAKYPGTAMENSPSSGPAGGGRSLAEVRIILEACPPAAADQDRAFAVLRQAFAGNGGFQAVTIPDIQDEEEFRRHRPRLPNDDFALQVRSLTEKPLSLYKVSVTCTQEEFERWLAKVEDLGCRDIFIVGPESSSKRYKPGALQVGEAARIARQRGFRCGGIIIPTRRRQFVPRPAAIDEAERIEIKVRQFGFSFFTTQIIYESEWMCCLLLDLVRRLRREEIPKIFLTFSPFVHTGDIQFAKNFLGIYLPADVERTLRGAQSMREASIACLLGIWERIVTFADAVDFPSGRLGINAEYIDSRNPRNVDAAFELAREFGHILKTGPSEGGV